MATDPTGERSHLQGAGMNTGREATADEQAGMDWWNALSEEQCARWLRAAGSAVPADAWAAYKRLA